MNQAKVIENLKRCPHFGKCNQNLCPMDLELNSRNGSNADCCRWMRNPKRKKINGREFISGGQVMPDGLLNFVPRANVKRLNEASRRRWFEINNH